jgi:predicted transposase YbfD/YdcC
MERGERRPSLIDHFSALEDPRQAWKVVYPLPEVLLLALCATLAGADDFVEVTAWGEEHLDFLRRFLPYADGIPSHDALNDVMNALDAGLFAACFTAWVAGLRAAEPDIVAIDGKASRRTHARARGRDPLHLVSAWASRQRLVLGQQATDAKSNEITAIPLLLERLALTGALVTIDAIGCQTKIAEAILGRGADYLLAIKANWPALHGEIVRYFADAPAADLDTYATTDGDHGRIEVRRHAVSRDVAWLSGDRRFPGEPRFPGLAAVAMVEAEVERPGRGQAPSRERRYFLSSAPLDARTFAHAARAHWGIENRLHWIMDVVFRDDLCRLRTGHGPANMATVRHMAVNLVRTAPGRHSLKVRRRRAAWNVGYLEALLRQTA